jgi:acetoacetyl-CoA synthetase
MASQDGLQTTRGRGASDNAAPFWVPPKQRQQASRMSHFMRWLTVRGTAAVDGYGELWEWSITEVEAFWESVWQYFDVRGSSYESVLPQRGMPGARWFTESSLSYAQHVFRNSTTSTPALVAATEDGAVREVMWDELAAMTAAAVAFLRRAGVSPGDHVCGYVTNTPESVAAFLACASLGAVWSSCPPEFGVSTAVDRLVQGRPKVLFAVKAYRYGGRVHDRAAAVAELVSDLGTVEHVVTMPSPLAQRESGPGVTWEQLLVAAREPLSFEQVPFEHPLWVLFSSGTTGRPKAIVQSHGGILLEHLKVLALQMDLGERDRYFWFTTTGWMMWNFLLGGLLVGATPVLYDGSPTHPDAAALWRTAERTGVTYLGTSPAYIATSKKQEIVPRRDHDLSRVRTVATAGAPLPDYGYDWVYEAVGEDVWLNNTSGGTEVCSGLTGGAPLVPVYRGEMSCRYLGAKVEAFDEHGRSVIDRIGEMVITEPMPSMPTSFLGDTDGRRLVDTYFQPYAGVWRHGDWIKITPRGSAVIYGRSDATINRGGVRMGTMEVYAALEAHPSVVDSLVVGLELSDGRYMMPSFVVLAEGVDLDDDLEAALRSTVRERLSPRHVPDVIMQVRNIPRTLTGKKMEVPVKRLLLGADPADAINADAMANPESIAEVLHAWDRAQGGCDVHDQRGHRRDLH